MRIESKEPLMEPPPDHSRLTTENYYKINTIADQPIDKSSNYYKVAVKVGIVIAWILILMAVGIVIIICSSVVVLFIKLLSLLMIGI